MIWQPHELLKPPSDEEMAVMEPADLVAIHQAYHEAIENSVRDPFRYGFLLPNWKRSWEMWRDVRTLLLLGANRCLAPDQKIFDPVTGQSKAVSEIDGPFHVLAWDGAKTVVAPAEKPFRKPQAEIFRVVLDNGEALDCSAAHLLLTPGGWSPLGALSPGALLVSGQASCRQSLAPTISEPSHQEFRSGVGHSIRKALDSLARCLTGFRQCDEQLRGAQGSAQASFPSQGDAPKRKQPSGNIRRWPWLCGPHFSGLAKDVQGNRPSSIHSSLGFFLRSTLDVLVPTSAPAAGIRFRNACKPSELACDRLQFAERSNLGFSLPRSTRAFSRLGNQFDCELPCGEDERLAPTVKIKEIYSLRTDWVWDFTVPKFHNYIAAGVVNHNSGKTAFGAKTVVKALLENPNSTIYCFCQNESISVEVQQAAIYQQLPAELKRKNTGDVHYISYSAQNGFTSKGFILPNGSRCKFLFYTQFQQDQSILEGMELGSRSAQWINVGAWCDEYLSGMEILDRLYLRLATRNAKLLLTFTPKDGITDTVSNYITGAETLEKRDAPLLREIHKQENCEVPYVQVNPRKNTAILYFHTKDNPWSGYESVVEMCRAKSDYKYTLTAAYGVPTKSYTTKFPKFGAHNIIDPDKIPKTGVTRYQIIDPAGKKNWATAWICVAADGTWYVENEWPDQQTVGPWIEPGKNGKWAPGDGAKGLGYGYRDYLDVFADIEGKKEVFERLIDPRLGAQRYQKDDADSCIIDDLNDLDFIVKPAPGIEIEDGLQKLSNLMAYDDTRPIDGTNRPKFYVSSACQNMILCLNEYTGDQGKDEPAKDFVDLCRYAAAAEIDHLELETAGRQRRSGY